MPSVIGIGMKVDMSSSKNMFPERDRTMASQDKGKVELGVMIMCLGS